MTHTADSDRARQGIALVVVLWGLVLIAIIAGSFAAGTRTNATMAFNVAENAKARALAEAGVQRGILELLRRAESTWRADGTAYPVRAPGGEIAIALQDELGRIDLNTAPDELMRALFVSVGIEDGAASALADAVADFRDDDDLVRLNGAEARDYRAAGLRHQPKNAPFEAIEELRLVLGMSEPLYRRVARLITVHSRRRWVNLATAPPEVLLALPGLDDEGRERILESRGTAVQYQHMGVPAVRPAVTATPFGRVATTGNIVTIRAEARTDAGGVFIRSAIVRADGPQTAPYRYLGWKQDMRRTAPAVAGADEADGRP